MEVKNDLDINKAKRLRKTILYSALIMVLVFIIAAFAYFVRIISAI